MPHPAISRRLLLTLLAPLALVSILSFALRPRPASLLAPVLGPWAGLSHGHTDCTMAKMLPGPSYAMVVALPVVLFLYFRARSRRARAALAVLSFLAVLAWSALAALSVANASQ